MKKTRRKFTGAFKAKVAIEALKERESLAELRKPTKSMTRLCYLIYSENQFYYIFLINYYIVLYYEVFHP